MNIAELFVSLGVKGGNDTKNTLKDVKGGMRDIKSISLEAKAAILAAVYGLKSLTQQSLRTGVSLNQFNNLTGLSTKKLQQWQYANKQAGGTAEEVTGVVTSMQQAFAQLELGEGPAKYMGLFADELARVGESLDVTQMKDSFYTLEKFRAFIKKGGTGNIGVDNEIGTSLGITPNMIANMRGGLFDDKILNTATTYSVGQAKELQRVNAKWVQLGDIIEKTIGELNIQFGGQLVNDLKTIVKELANLIVEFAAFAKQIELFDKLRQVLENIANIISFATGSLSEWNKTDTKEHRALAAVKDEMPLTDQFFSGLKTLYKDILYDSIVNGGPTDSSRATVESMMKNNTPGVASASQPTTVVQQTIHVGQGTNVPAVKEAAKTGSIQGVQSAYRQLSAQGL